VREVILEIPVVIWVPADAWWPFVERRIFG